MFFEPPITASAEILHADVRIAKRIFVCSQRTEVWTLYVRPDDSKPEKPPPTPGGPAQNRECVEVKQSVPSSASNRRSGAGGQRETFDDDMERVRE